MKKVLDKGTTKWYNKGTKKDREKEKNKMNKFEKRKLEIEVLAEVYAFCEREISYYENYEEDEYTETKYNTLKEIMQMLEKKL